MDAWCSATPYPLVPLTTPQALAFLADAMHFPRRYVNGGGVELLKTLCGVVLIRHMPDHEKREVWGRIEALRVRNSMLAQELQDRALGVKINPEWGLWSLSNRELHANLAEYEKLEIVAAILDMPAGGKSVTEALRSIIFKRGPLGIPAAAIVLVIVGLNWSLIKTVESYSEEIRRRSIEIKSRYYK